MWPELWTGLWVDFRKMEVLGCGEFLLRFGPLGGKTREISFLFFFELRFSKKKKESLEPAGKNAKTGGGA